VTSHWTSLDESPPPGLAAWRSIDEEPPRRVLLLTTRWLLSVVAAAAGLLILVGAAGGYLLGRRKAAPANPVAATPPPEEPSLPERARLREFPPAPEPEPIRTPYAEELTDLDRETSAPETKEEFRLVLDVLRRARGRHADPAWAEAVDRRVEAIQTRVAAHFALLEQRFKEAPADEAARMRERVARWGLDEYVAKLDPPPAVKTPPPEPKPEPAKATKLAFPTEAPRTAGAKVYLESWTRAAARATQRDFDTAAAELRRAGRLFEEEETRREAAADQEDFRRAAAILQDAGEAFARSAPGTALSLECRDAAGVVRKVSGLVVRNDPDRAELAVPGTRETVFAEYADVTAPSIAEFLRAKGKAADARTAAILCLLEGATEAAARLLGSGLDAVPAKYWAYSEAVRVRPPAPDPARRQEESARQLYYAAEREFRAPQTRGPAVEKYRILAKEFFDTSLVRRAAQRISQRSDACKEYFFGAADARGAGTFRKVERPPPVGPCWTSRADTDLSRGNENYVEVEFYAMTEAPYRCWAQVGACCVESFLSFYQTTDLVAPHPTKPNVLLPVEPATRYGLPLPPPSLPVKMHHADHAPGKPKEPTVWAWIEVPLPKYKAAGLKKLRIITHQEGFSVARVLVSSSRKTAPVPAEVKELETSRE